ncbi:amidinotransferase [Allokutzneria sp. A3M-2-11 16]|uniref:amidinotransferase n=1 Tax=Allokutzneria sp. A3M-2-11 16 TaxID=2962043 RepID=UPI0020B87A4E|nr:amidinotransferase [Allokutzneria sp. A3M-2-11 16]MCP3803561.1 amidinotransferase [Allokutzneria sp. A3M-2-11 16]
MIAVVPPQPSLDPWEPALLPANPSQLTRPAFLMNAPFSWPVPRAQPAERVPRPRRAFAQFFDLYHLVAAEALVTVLPTPGLTGVPDLVFTANLGVVLEHLNERDTVVISNQADEVRRAEAAVGADFFRAMGYRTHVPEGRFGGEADLKHLRGNVYAGGHGRFSEPETYDWMEGAFEMEVVRLALTDPGLSRLDQVLFPLTKEKTLVCTELFERAELAALERHTEIVQVSIEDCRAGACGSVRLHNVWLNSSHVHDLRAGTEEYQREVAKNRRIEDIAATLAFEVNYVNLSEYRDHGAQLSALLLHLNRFSYAFQLL